MRWLGALALLLANCGPQRTATLESIFDGAQNELRAGEAAQAQLSAERGLAAADSRHDTYFHWKFRLLRSETLLLSKRAEEVVNQLGEAAPRGDRFEALAARKLMLQGQAASILGHADQFAEYLRQAKGVAEASHAYEVLTEIEIVESTSASRTGNYDEAERLLRGALERARHSNLTDQEASALVNLGMLRIKRNRYDDAAGFFEEAAAKTGPRLQLLHSVAQTNLALCYAELGEYDRAIQIYKSSLERYERTGAKYYLRYSLGETGHLYLLKGDLKAAVPYLQRALSLASEMGGTMDAAIWAGNLSAVYCELGDWKNATTLNAEAARLKKSANIGTLVYNTLNAARIAGGSGEKAEAVRLFERALDEGKDDPEVQWEAHEGLANIAVRSGQTAEAVRQFEASLAIVEKTRGDLMRTEFKLPFLTRLIRFYQVYANFLVDQGQYERALAVADSSRAQVLAERYGSAPRERLAPGGSRALAREFHAVLLAYSLGLERSHAWVVAGGEVHHVELPPAGQIEPLVREYQDAIERRLADPMRVRLMAGERLYEMLIAPLRQWIPAGSRVILTPDGALHGLNFESLPVPGETPRFLIQDVTLTLAPALGLLAGTQPPRTARRLLLLGDPVSSDPSFPRLPQAAQEIASVTGRFGGTDNVVLSGAGATPEAWRKAAPGSFSAIHFTAHAVANGESPLDSAVLLSGGKLYARDVMDVPLKAELVTVSACRGAGARTYSGEGLVGFAWAFLRAGSRSVIAGLWDVNDQSTATLMDALYAGMAAGKGPAEALRSAKLAMIANPGNLHKPYYWAPFQLYTVAP